MQETAIKEKKVVAIETANGFIQDAKDRFKKETGCFWTEKINGKSTTYTFPSAMAINFLSEAGYCKYKDYYIQLIDGVAEKVTQKEAFVLLFEHVKKFNESSLESSFTQRANALIMNSKTFMLTLPKCDQYPNRDTKKISYHYYKNCVVKVTAGKGLETIPYSKIDGFVWKSSIKDRDFEILKKDEITNSMFFSFLQNVSNKDANTLVAMFSAIGYLLHKYKDPANPKAIILNDLNLEEGTKPEGRTGKGIIAKAVGHIVNRLIFNGKNVDFKDNRFVFAGLNDETNILFIDDVGKGFYLENLFSVLAEDMSLEKKRQDPIQIKYKDSPKFMIATNYTIRGNTSSAIGRRNDIFLYDHYSADHTPYDDFKCEFFGGWNENEWLLFDNLMMNCLHIYLTEGLVLQTNDSVKLKMFQGETHPDFWDVMDKSFSEFDTRYYKSDVRNKMISDYGSKHDHLNRDHGKLKQWVTMYAEYRGFKVLQDSGQAGAYFEFLTK